MTLGLVRDGAGFPRTCETLPGNVSEPGTLQEAIARLNASVDGQTPTVIMDGRDRYGSERVLAGSTGLRLDLRAPG